MNTPWMRMRPGSGTDRGDLHFWRQKAIDQLKPNIKDEADAFKTYTEIANTLRAAGEPELAEIMLGVARDENRHHGIILDLISKVQAAERGK